VGEARVYVELEVRRVPCRRCGKVKQEKLPWLSDNGSRSLSDDAAGRQTIRDVACELHLDWKTVKDLEQYMREQLQRTGTPTPRAVGIDEISIRKRPVL